MIVYCLHPIDMWTGWISEADYKKQLISYMDHDLHAAADAWDEYIELRQKASELGKQLGWEGDIRDDTVDIAGLPADGDGQILIGWKQDNNGTTFVASQFPLPWLEHHAVAKLVG